MDRRAIAVLLALVLLLSGCGGDDGSAAGTTSDRAATSRLGHGSTTRDCDIVFDGPGPANWRLDSDWSGPLGVAGRGPGPDFSEGSFDDEGLYMTKTPTLVEGHLPVTISLARGEARRAGLLTVDPERAYASVTYRPCADKPRTVFAAGFLVRDRQPVLLMVQVGDGPVQSLAVGGAGHARVAEIAPRASALRAGVVGGALRDFESGTGVGPTRFPHCFTVGLSDVLTIPRLTQLTSVYRRQGQPYATQALARVAVPIGDRCGGGRFVPELIAAGAALGKAG